MSMMPHSHIPKASGQPSQKSASYYNSKGGLNLQWAVQQTHMGMMVRCPPAPGHIVRKDFLKIIFKKPKL